MMTETELEMISKVDRGTLEKIFQAYEYCCRRDSDIEDKTNIKNDVGIVDTYLEHWARAKSWLYELFGRKLSVEKEINCPDDDDNIINDIRRMLQKKSVTRNTKNGIVEVNTSHFQTYQLLLKHFGSESLAGNVLVENEELQEFCGPCYKPGMKLSRFLSMYFNDLNFDIELSKCYQAKRNKRKLVISIDPCELLMISETTSSWGIGSCYGLKRFFRCGNLNMMLDNATAVMFSPRKNKHCFTYGDINIEMTDKQCRSVLAMDKETKAFLCVTDQGSPGRVVKKEFIEMVKGLTGKAYVDNPSLVVLRNDGGDFYNSNPRHTHFEGESLMCNGMVPDDCHGRRVTIETYADVICLGNKKKYIPKTEHRNPYAEGEDILS